MIDAVRNYGRRVEGQGVRKVTLELDDGSKRKIVVPREEGILFPAPVGWSVLADQGGYNGESFALTGKKLAVFRELVDADGEWVRTASLKVAVWDEHTDDRTVQNAVSQLRAAIRTGMAWGEDIEPIDADGDRYRLARVETV